MEPKEDLNSYEFKTPIKLPYSPHAGEWNGEKSRIIACKYCKYKIISNVFTALCGVCGHEMISVV